MHVHMCMECHPCNLSLQYRLFLSMSSIMVRIFGLVKFMNIKNDTCYMYIVYILRSVHFSRVLICIQELTHCTIQTLVSTKAKHKIQSVIKVINYKKGKVPLD